MICRYALSISAAAVLAACGVLRQTQDDVQPLIGVPGAIPANSAQYRVVYRFPGGVDGAHPRSDLILVNDKLYGTTSGGGRHAPGTVYTISATGEEKVLYVFHGPPADGANPQAGLVDVNGTLYGTTGAGGSSLACREGCGTVFSIRPSGQEKVLYSFKDGTDGRFPNSSLVDVNGTLYGITAAGGLSNCSCGTVFRISRSGKFTVLYDFNAHANKDGWQPDGLTNVNGTLYGTTYYGGAANCGSGCGTVFTISTGGKERVLYDFAGWNNGDGAFPYGRLISVNGTLYGTTEYGGSHCIEGCGTVFSITTSGKEKVVYSFAGTDGATPVASLIDVNGTLYGTTDQGGQGASSRGVIYSVSTSGTEKVLHSFSNGNDGAGPLANLIDVKGTLYGTTVAGGGTTKCPGGCGIAFRLVP